MAVKSCEHHEICHKSTKLTKVDCYRLQITTDLPLQWRERSVMFVNNVFVTVALLLR